MAGVLWIILLVFCPFVLSESGDDDWSDKEVTCTSTLTRIHMNLTCSLNDEPIDEFIFATLCKMKETHPEECTNATLGGHYFSFVNLLMSKYKLSVHLLERFIEQDIDLTKIDKIPTPEIKLATYMEDTDEIFVWFEHSLSYVLDCHFQVKILRDKPAKEYTSSFMNGNISISRHRIGGDGVFYARVRARLGNSSANGLSEWSSKANFSVKSWSDKKVICTSTLTLFQNNLTCSLNDEPTEEFKSATLCDKEKCINATLGPEFFSFVNLQILTTYTLSVHLINHKFQRDIVLTQIVKIPAPELKLATYMEDIDNIFVWFEHSHKYVRDCEFQVEIWGDKLAKPISTFIMYRNITIGRDRLGGDGVYYARVRAKPVGYFAGDWSEWSSNASFSVKQENSDSSMQMSQIVIIITLIIILVLIIILATLRWRTQIKNYITPNIPHPKATLAQMHWAKEGFPFTFSPEIFSDVFIHRLDYVDEKPFSPELQDSLNELRYSRSSYGSASVSEMDVNANEWVPREQSHLKIRLLDESDLSKVVENTLSPGLIAPQPECKEEAYVTMSSLFKTQ